MILFRHTVSGEFFDIDNLESPANDDLPQGSQSLTRPRTSQRGWMPAIKLDLYIVI